MHSLAPLAAGPAETVAITRALASLAVAVGSVVLLFYLYGYVRHVLSGPHGRGWWYLGIAVAAGALYGLAGLADFVTAAGWLGVFAEGATLFFILFLALGIRALYHYGIDPADRTLSIPDWADNLVIAGFIVAWWAGFLTDRGAWIAVVVSLGWVLASAWAVGYAVLTVRTHEGTSIAALVRHLLPALVSFVGIVVAGLAGQYTAGFAAYVEAAWIVGTVLVGAFLFTTAVALRQQGGEVKRMYDWTTWRG